MAELSPNNLLCARGTCVNNTTAVKIRCVVSEAEGFRGGRVGRGARASVAHALQKHIACTPRAHCVHMCVRAAGIPAELSILRNPQHSLHYTGVYSLT
ncbi:hypothetical protein B5X24_HaOG203640 [Helicoverpa armigera]|uniref:Uncharacterized protein n=1 Tax=Helicoverpa armigera TaxID=29058 RepID=A0A2W1BZI6_HELAM|nr:hypothetical protein B5X24_HaOG203640 [Helicoverpa armigera]